MRLEGVQPIERRPSDRRSTAFDVALAVVVATAECGRVLSGPNPVGASDLALSIALGLVLTWRRHAPVPVLSLTLALTVAIIVLGEAPSGVSPLVALYTTAALCERRVSLIGLAPALVVAALVAMATLDSGRGGPGSDGALRFAITNAVLPIGVWGLGSYMQTRRRYLRELELRADQLERERGQLAHIAVMEERTSIARELHDIVAHSVTVMLLGVRGARDVLRTAPDVADDTLARVEVTGEQSVAELRRILTLLRESDDPAQSRPQPSLTDLGALLEEHRAAGLPVSLSQTGRPQPLPDGVGLSIVRVVQEALTNVVKHASATKVSVSVAYRDGGLALEIVNDGTALSADGAPLGHGLVGMRERVALLGGTLEAGPQAGRRFRVAAWLPLQADR